MCDVFVVDFELSAAVLSQDVCYKSCDIETDQVNHVCETGFQEVTFVAKPRHTAQTIFFLKDNYFFDEA